VSWVMHTLRGEVSKELASLSSYADSPSVALHCTAFSKCCAMQCQTPRETPRISAKNAVDSFGPKTRAGGAGAEIDGASAASAVPAGAEIDGASVASAVPASAEIDGASAASAVPTGAEIDGASLAAAVPAGAETDRVSKASAVPVEGRQYQQKGLPPLGPSPLGACPDLRHSRAPSTDPTCISPSFPFCTAVQKEEGLVQLGFVLGALAWRRSGRAPGGLAPIEGSLLYSHCRQGASEAAAVPGAEIGRASERRSTGRSHGRLVRCGPQCTA
jgi:hypothetical protein